MPSGESPNDAGHTGQGTGASPEPTAAATPSGATAGGELAPRPRKPRRSRARSSEPATIALPVLIVDETILLPHMSIPFPIEDDESSLVLDSASRLPLRQVLVLTERITGGSREGMAQPDSAFAITPFDAVPYPEPADPDGRPEREPAGDWAPDSEPDLEQFELCTVGVIAEVGQRISRPGGHSHLILQGVSRGVVVEMIQNDPYPVARIQRHDDPPMPGERAEAAMTAILEQVESYLSMLPSVPEEVLATIRGVNEPGWLADLIAFSPEFNPDQRQTLLEVLDPLERLRMLGVLIERRLSVLNLRQQIQHEAQAGMDRQQQEYYLREQIRAIQKELGEGSAEETLARELRDKVQAAGMPDEVRDKALVQVERLEQQHPFSPELGIIRSYLEWLIELPWAVTTEERLDLAEVARTLDEDHYGLEKVKERILEYLAVRSEEHTS